MTQSKDLWHTIDYSKCLEDDALHPLSKKFAGDLRSGLAEHGLVIIDNIDLDETELVKLTQMVGNPLNLPKQLVPSKLPGFPEIARVGNFGEEKDDVDPSYAFGHYWHHDGDFWPKGKNHVINFLHSKILPKGGGQTGFISTVEAYASLDDKTKREIVNAVVVVDPSNIEDFRGIPEEEWHSDLVGEVVEHPVVQDLEGRKSLYLPFYEYNLTLSSGEEVSYDDLFKRLFNKPEVHYYHNWSENQLVVWDNLKVMHRAMGGIEGRRLLWRTQGLVLA
jgi:taurine dioxygenase